MNGKEEVRGTLAALRRVSARLFFGDLEADGAEAATPWSLVFKRDRWCGPRPERSAGAAR